MGHWGSKIDDNDTASDLMLDFADYIAKGDNPQQALTKLLNSWYGSDNDALLMVAEYYRLYELNLDEELAISLNLVFIEELNNLSNWREPDNRRLVLTSIIEALKPLGFVPSDDLEKVIRGLY
jgi:hypothetical protein